MAKGEALIFVANGMDQDSGAINVIPKDSTEGRSGFELGSIRYALNSRYGSSVSDNQGAVENIPSTLEINTYYVWNGSAFVLGSAAAGTNTSINKFEDKPNGVFYFFVQNSNGNDSILKFVKSERKIYELVRWTFGFDITKYISCCKISNYLIFTDNTSAPRIINITSVYQLRLTLGSAFSEYHVSLSKWAPLPAPLVRRNTVGTSEFVRKGIFQFTYRYIYSGGFKSTFAPPSWFVTNEITGDAYTFNVAIPGCILNENDPATPIFHNSAAFYDFVDFIEIVYRESVKDPWKLFKRHTVTSGNNTFHDFENNGPQATIPQTESGQYFDSVPFLSGAVEAIDNRPMLADNTDELLVEPLTITDVEVYAIPSSSDNWNGPQASFSSLSGPQQIELGRILNTRQFSFLEGGLYKCAILYQHNTGRTGLAQTTQNWSYLIPPASEIGFGVGGCVFALGFKIDASIIPPVTATAYQILRTNCLNIGPFIYGTVNDFIYLGLPPAPQGEENQTPQAAIDILNDYFNSNINNISDGFNISERLANYYRREQTVATLAECSRIGMSIKNWTQVNTASSGGATMNPSNNVFYNWRKGDRVKFLASRSTDPDVAQVFDEEIADYNGNLIFINKPTDVLFLPNRANPSATARFFEIEIYRPNKFSEGDTVLFYEMGEWYPITQPTTPSRDFIKRDFTWGGASAVTQTSFGDHVIYQRMPLVNGDVWMVNKSMYYDWVTSALPGVSERTKYMQMTQDKFNAGGFWEHNNGKPYPGYSYLPFQTEKLTQLRFGGKFLQDSVFNSINTFLADAQFIYPAEYGRIRALVNISNAQVESVGNILLAIGEQEAWSIYVNRTTLEDLSGSTQVSLSDKVLGSYNTLLGSHGTLNPDSVSRNSGRAVWWNAKRGVWVRYSRDGLTIISDRKMSNWFKGLGDLLINEYASTPPKVLSTYDQYHNEWVTFINHSVLPSTYLGYDVYKCMSFSEVLGRWGTVFDYAPQVIASLDNEVYSIIGTKVYIHEEGTGYNSFYGVKKDTLLQPVANPEMRKMKVWEAIGLIASDGWSFENIDGDWRSNSQTRQNSRIPLTSLVLREDTYWADLKRDLNSVNVSNPIVSGNPMRSKAITIMMKLDPAVTWLSVFNWLAIEYNISEKTLKK